MFLKDLQPGEMFRRENGTFRYVKSNSKKEEPGGGYYCYNLDGDSEGYFQPGTTSVIPVLPDWDPDTVPTFQPEPRAPGPFYMCYVQGGDSPRQKHIGVVARQEAERLAKLTGKPVFVLKTVACVDYTPPTARPSFSWKRFDRKDC